MSIRNTQIDGDVSVGRNASLGGKLTVQGKGHVKGDLRVDGWLDAPNVKQPCMGLHATKEKLEAAYPRPRNGWWALVGDTLPADVYRAECGQWVATGQKAGEPNLALDSLQEQVDGLQERVDEVESDIGTLNGQLAGMKSDISSLQQSSYDMGRELDGLQSEVDGLQEEVDGLPEKINGQVDTKLLERELGLLATSLAWGEHSGRPNSGEMPKSAFFTLAGGAEHERSLSAFGKGRKVRVLLAATNPIWLYFTDDDGEETPVGGCGAYRPAYADIEVGDTSLNPRLVVRNPARPEQINGSAGCCMLVVPWETGAATNGEVQELRELIDEETGAIIPDFDFGLEVEEI